MTRTALPAWIHRGGHLSAFGSRHVSVALALIVSFVVAALLWARWGSKGEAQLERLSDEQRRALYDRTLSDLELCDTASGAALGDHCIKQAEFIVKFSECNGRCQELARAWLSRPTR